MPRCKHCKRFLPSVCAVDTAWHKRQAAKIERDLQAKIDMDNQVQAVIRRHNNAKRFAPVEKKPVTPVLDHLPVDEILAGQQESVETFIEEIDEVAFKVER